MASSKSVYDTTHEPPMVRPAALRDLLADLNWPRVIRAPAMALRPERYLASLLGVVVFVLVGWGVGAIAGVGNAADLFVQEKLRTGVGLGLFSSGVWRLESHTFWGDEGLDWWSASALGVMGLLAIGLWAWLGGLIGRSTALEIAHRASPGLRTPVSFATRRWVSTLVAIVGPALIVIVPTLTLGVLFRLLGLIPFVDVVMAALFGPLMVVGVLAMIGALALGLAGIMLAPAVACEASDGIDATQRVLAYVVARPLYALWTLIAMWFSAGLALLALAFAITHAMHACVALTGLEPMAGEEPTLANDLVVWWIDVVRLLWWALLVSVAHTGGTLVYLVLRETCDGQHWRDIDAERNGEVDAPESGVE